MRIQKIRSIKKLGVQKTIDLNVNHVDHNFYADGIVVSNSHATGYAFLTCYTAFLKANYPLEFFYGCLKVAKHEADPIERISLAQIEMEFFGFKLLPPDIVSSKSDFSIEKNGSERNIRMGLSSIKGISEKGQEKLKIFNKQNPTKFDIFVSLMEAKLPLNVITPLVLAGCIKDDSTNRQKLLFEIELWKILNPKEQVIAFKLAKDYNNDLSAIVVALSNKHKDEKGKFLIKESRFNTIKRNVAPIKERYRRNIINKDLSNYIFEQTFLGFSFSKCLKDIYSPFCKDLWDIKTILSIDSGESFAHVRLVALVDEVERKKSSAKKTPYLSIILKDNTGTIKAMLFTESKIKEMFDANGQRDPKKGDIVIVNAQKKTNVLFVDSISIQENSVIIKNSELKLGEEESKP